jgi:hypothetical protein
VVLIAGSVGHRCCAGATIAAAALIADVAYSVSATRANTFTSRTGKLAAEHKTSACVCHSRPGSSEVSRDYQHEGRVSIELLKALLP